MSKVLKWIAIVLWTFLVIQVSRDMFEYMPTGLAMVNTSILGILHGVSAFWFLGGTNEKNKCS